MAFDLVVGWGVMMMVVYERGIGWVWDLFGF